MKNNTYLAQIRIEDEELNEILKELEEAREAILKCYDKLRGMGVIVVEKKKDGST